MTDNQAMRTDPTTGAEVPAVDRDANNEPISVISGTMSVYLWIFNN